MRRTREVVLAHVVHAPPRASDFEIIERVIAGPPAGMLHIRLLWIAIDPYLPQAIRGRHFGMAASGAGETLPGESIGVVLTSGSSKFSAGDYVVGPAGWAEEAIVAAEKMRRVEPEFGLPEHLGILGMTGMTAWAGMTQLASVKPGDVVCIDAAAGPVGGTAGQIARLLGAEVVGIAGGAAKARLATEVYKFDRCVDYTAADWEQQLPSEIDVHFENVGQRVLDAVLPRLRAYGQVVLCGLAQHYADASPAFLSAGLLMGKRATVRGLIVYDFLSRRDEWLAFAAPQLRAGKLVEWKDVVQGLDAAPEQLERVAQGRTLGRALVRIQA